MKSIHKKKAIHVLLCRFDKTNIGQSELINWTLLERTNTGSEYSKYIMYVKV